MTDDVKSEEELFMSSESLDVEQEPITEPEQPVETVEVTPLVETEPEVTAEPEVVEPVAEEQPETDAQVPSWRLREIREAKEAEIAKQTEALTQERNKVAQFEAQVQQLQTQLNQHQQKPAPDMFEKPDEWQQHIQGDYQQQIQTFQQEQAKQMARLEAMTIHGADTVQTAMEAAIKAEASNPSLGARIAGSPNPYTEAVNWHKESQVHEQIGEGGIDAFRERTREELMKDPEFRKQVVESLRGEAGGVGNTTTQTIPSLNNAPRVQVKDNGDPIMSDAELFNS